MTSMLLGRTEYVLFYRILIERNTYQKTICLHNQKKMLHSERVKVTGLFGLVIVVEY